MKNLFGGFYGASEHETKTFWTSPDSVFVFDTNALLLLYRCERETREAFFSQWEKIRERVWLPYHVCLEYQRNRLTAIKDHVKELRNAGAHISSRIETAADLNQFDPKYRMTIKRYESLRGKVTELAKELQGTVDRFVQEQIETRISEADFLTNHDTVRDRISDLIGERIGNPPTEKEINQLQQTGEIRFSKEIPPGFEDAKTKKDETFTFNKITYKRKFGDWFIWNEILMYASEKKPAAVIFVTNDNKKDWLYETGGQTRGPHESLKTELAEQGEGTHFLMYSSASFLNAANKNLEGQATSPEAIKELERVSVRVYADEDHFNLSRLQEQLEKINLPSVANDYGSFTKHLFNEPNWYKITNELINTASPVAGDILKIMRDAKIFTPELKNEVLSSLIKNNKLHSIDYYDIHHNHKNDDFQVNEDDADKTDEDEKP